MKNSLRIAFMGSPACALPVLEMLRRSGHDLACVYTQPPRPGKRGKIQNTPVHACAAENVIDVRTPENFKPGTQDRQDFINLDLDAAIVAGYGMILPEAVLRAPRFGCLNVHPSLLPRWRGTSPVQQAIRAGDTESGVSIIRLVKKMDAGPVLAQTACPLGPDMTAQALDGILWRAGAKLLEAVLADYAAGRPVPETQQDESRATYAPLLTREDGKIDWHTDAESIDRQIRALTPWPGAWTHAPCATDGPCAPVRLKILAAAMPSAPQDKVMAQTKTAPYETQTRPGALIDRTGHVVCAGGTVLRLESVQPPGRKPMPVSAAINGGYLWPGCVLAS